MLNQLSIIGLIVMILAAARLALTGNLLAVQPILLSLQGLAIGLMIWARLAFGLRSFHASAAPTTGKLITTGPYRYIRHPIYTAGCLLIIVGILSHWSLWNSMLGTVFFFGALTRISCEEQLLLQKYPEYFEYQRATKRMVPLIF